MKNSLSSRISNVFKPYFQKSIFTAFALVGLAGSVNAQCNITIVTTGTNSSGVLCTGNSVTLTTDAISNYSWSTGSTSSSIVVSPNVTTTYTLNATSSSNCPGSATVMVSVVTTPAIPPTASPSLVCIGNSSTLTAAGATSYTWTDGTQSVNTPTFLISPPAGISTYTIVRANASCSSTQQISIVTNTLPTIFAIISPTLVCALQPATLAVAGGQSYTWTSPGMPPTYPSFTFTGASPLVFPPTSTIYTVAASDGTCINTTTVAVATNPNPTLVTSANPPLICSGGSVTINASGGDNYTITANGSTTTLNSVPFVLTPTASTSFNIIGDNSFGCTSAVNQIVIVNPNPILTASVVANKTLVCSGGSVALNATGANTYSWSSGALTQSTIVNPVSLVSGPVIYTVTGTNTLSTCHSDKTVAVTIFIPTITVTGNTSTCIGGIIHLTASGGTGNNNYHWYTVAGDPATSNLAALNLSIATSAVFTITALTTSATAVLCPSTKTVDVTVFYNPTITAVAQRTPICVKENVDLVANGGSTYLWNTGGNTQTVTVSPNNNTTYTVTGTDVNGCINTGTVLVKVSACSGINEINSGMNIMNIYPNPNTGEFTIQSESNLKLSLVNDLGQIIQNIELSGANDYKISMSNLAKGIYFLSGEKDNTQIRQKIIVIR